MDRYYTINKLRKLKNKFYNKNKVEIKRFKKKTKEGNNKTKM